MSLLFNILIIVTIKKYYPLSGERKSFDPLFYLTNKKRFHKTVNAETVTMFFHDFNPTVVCFLYYMFSIYYKIYYAKTKFHSIVTRDFALLARCEHNTL